jgi:5-methyltetrahydrofolate--homocysteine methyltransferase
VEILKQIAQHLINGDEEEVEQLTRQAVDQGLPGRQVLDDGLIAGMNVVGEQFRNHEMFLPDVLLAARAMHVSMAILKPRLLEEDVPSRGKVVLGTVEGDQHDIGKNLVSIMLQGAGFDVIDLGYNVPADKFIAAARENNAPLIGMSALLTTTMPAMQRVITRLKEEGLAGAVRTIIGGAPVSADFARQIGADAYARDAAHAVDQVKTLMGVA